MKTLSHWINFLQHDLRWFHCIAWIHGVLLAAAVYLFVCVDQGYVSWQHANFFILTGAGGLCLSATSVTHEGKWSWKSLIPLIILIPAYAWCLLFYALIIGFPGSDMPTRDVIGWFVLFPVFAASLHVMRRGQSMSIVVVTFLSALLIGAACIHVLSTYRIQTEIAAVLTHGGCVFAVSRRGSRTPKAILSTDDIRIGIVSAWSDRIYFINGPKVATWSYTAIAPVNDSYFDERILSGCSR
jgi:hypothetical protein